jgi:hypothetical protein
MHRLATALRPALLLAGFTMLSACATSNDLDEPPAPLGDFKLGYDIVVAKNAKPVPPSREATPEEWQAILTEEIDKRFRRYDGDRLYHIAVNVDGYSLAYPGIPVVAAPKSILVVSANVWDDGAGKKLNAEAEQIQVFESVSGDTIVGSGLTMSREEQMRNLAANVAKRIELWLVQNRETWFSYDPSAAPVPAVAEGAEGMAPPAVSEAPLIEPEGPVEPTN